MMEFAAGNLRRDKKNERALLKRQKRYATQLEILIALS